MAKRLTYYILAGLVLGVLAGWALNANSEAIRQPSFRWGWIGEDKTAAQCWPTSPATSRSSPRSS